MDRTDFKGWTLGLLLKSISNNRQYLYKITEQSDKIIVWLVGFSITAIALSISKESELNSFIGYLSHYIIILGSLTIIFGIFYRIFLYLAQALEIQITMRFEGFIEGYTNPPEISFGREIDENDTYEDIVDYLKFDFDVEIEKVDTKNFDDKQINLLREATVNYYLSLNNWSNKNLEKEIDEIKSVLASYLGYSNKKLNRMFSNKKPRLKITQLYWFFIRSASVLFILSCLAFTSGIMIVMIKYIAKIYN